MFAWNKKRQLPVCRTDKNPLGTKGRTSILSVESSASCGASFPVSRRKLLDRECFVTSFRQGGYTPLCCLCVYPLWTCLPQTVLANRSPPASCKKSMMEVLNLKRAAKLVLIGVCFGLILLFLKISFRIDDAAFMHGYWIAAVEITPSRVPTVAIVIPEVSTDTVTLETVSTILSFLLSVCLFSLYRSVNRIACLL